MSTTPSPLRNDPTLSRLLDRLMRRQGVKVDQVPDLEEWMNFVLAVDQTLNEHRVNRELLEQSVISTSQKLNQAYEDLKAESKLRLAQADSHQRQLENLVQARTIELKSAQLHLENINKRLAYDATHDYLTGLSNRKHLIQALNHALMTVQDSTSPGLCFFFIDFNRFKYINERFGHLVGDQVLIHVASRFSELVQDATCLARLGGDEFVILTEWLNEADAIRLAQEITAIFIHPICVDDTEITLLASVGIVLADQSYQSVDDVVRDADIAMYHAKANGHCYQLFDEHMRTEHLAKIELERELEIFVQEQQFCINFEPIIDTQSAEIFSIESLVRWLHPEKGWIAPDQFIPLAEELGLIIEIDRIVFQKTCEYFRQWRSQHIIRPNQKFNVNLSCGQLERTDIVPFLLSTLKASDLSPQDVVLEITESYLLADSGLVMKNITTMNELGFSIFVDDFGTGYSSLSYLAKYPIHGLKIDRSFVRDLPESAEHRELIRSIIAMAEALNLKVVTEGVETQAQLQIMTELNCHYIQGFLFTRPMNASQATTFLLERPYQTLIEPFRIGE